MYTYDSDIRPILTLRAAMHYLFEACMRNRGHIIDRDINQCFIALHGHLPDFTALTQAYLTNVFVMFHSAG